MAHGFVSEQSPLWKGGWIEIEGLVTMWRKNSTDDFPLWMKQTHSLGEAILRETPVSWGFEWWGFSRSQYHIKDRGSACLFCSLFIYFLIEDLPSTCKEAIAREQKKMKLKIGGWVYLLPRAAWTKSLQTWWLKLVAGMSSVSALRARRLKSRCGQGWFLLDARGWVSFALLVFGGGRRC